MIDVERERASLAAELLGWMGEPAAALFPVDGPPDRDEARFADLALRVFAYQYAANEPYRRYCDRRGVRPGAVRRWQEIPAVATDAFKETPLTCFPSDDAAVVFVTSGTTQQARHGRHYLRSLDLYHAALAPAFAAHVLPGGARLPAVVLAFSSARMPQSSLSHMFDVVVERLCDGGDWYLEPDGLAVEATIRRLTALAAQDRPVLLMGTAFAFVHLLDALVADGRRLALPPGSRIMDTGGYKGRSRELPKAELYALYGDVLGVPDDHVVNEYGMTEMTSQFYDDALRRAALGLPAGPRRKASPPWVRTLVVDPFTMTPARFGRTGVLCHFDLGNLDSVMALQTADLGVADEMGFEILGRAAGAEARGCSLAVEELLDAQRRR